MFTKVIHLSPGALPPGPSQSWYLCPLVVSSADAFGADLVERPVPWPWKLNAGGWIYCSCLVPSIRLNLLQLLSSLQILWRELSRGGYEYSSKIAPRQFRGNIWRTTTMAIRLSLWRPFRLLYIARKLIKFIHNDSTESAEICWTMILYSKYLRDKWASQDYKKMLIRQSKQWVTWFQAFPVCRGRDLCCFLLWWYQYQVSSYCWWKKSG